MCRYCNSLTPPCGGCNSVVKSVRSFNVYRSLRNLLFADTACVSVYLPLWGKIWNFWPKLGIFDYLKNGSNDFDETWYQPSLGRGLPFGSLVHPTKISLSPLFGVIRLQSFIFQFIATGSISKKFNRFSKFSPHFLHFFSFFRPIFTFLTLKITFFTTFWTFGVSFFIFQFSGSGKISKKFIHFTKFFPHFLQFFSFFRPIFTFLT